MIQVAARPDLAIGQGLQVFPGLSFRITDQLFHHGQNGVRAVLPHEFGQALPGHHVGGNKPAEVQADHLRLAGHVHDHAPDVLAQLTFFDDTHRRHHQAFLLLFRGSDRNGTDRHAAHIHLVRGHTGPGNQLLLKEQGRHDSHVGMVYGALIGIIDDIHIAIGKLLIGEIFHHVAEDDGHGPGMKHHLGTH